MMDVVRRKSERVRVRKSIFTPGKTVNRKQHETNPQNSKEKSTNYELNKRKAVGKKNWRRQKEPLLLSQK